MRFDTSVQRKVRVDAFSPVVKVLVMRLLRQEFE